MRIRPLTPDLQEEYLLFFDNMIFEEHPEWSSCYCYDYHFTGDVSQCTRESNRDAVADLIADDKMSGFLAFDDGKPIGWCNANNRLHYQRLLKDYDYIDNPKDKVCSVVCFLIHPDYRRQGIAQQLLDRIIKDYSEGDFDYIESYPKKGELSCARSFKGPLALYQRHGFEVYKEYDDYYVMRKMLR